MPRRVKKDKDVIRIDEMSDDSDSESDTIRMEDARGVAVVNALYPQTMKNSRRHSGISKTTIIYSTGVFILLCNPLTEKLITTAFPIGQSWLVLLVIRTVLFFILMYFSNFLLSQK